MFFVSVTMFFLTDESEWSVPVASLWVCWRLVRYSREGEGTTLFTSPGPPTLLPWAKITFMLLSKQEVLLKGWKTCRPPLPSGTESSIFFGKCVFADLMRGLTLTCGTSWMMDPDLPLGLRYSYHESRFLLVCRTIKPCCEFSSFWGTCNLVNVKLIKPPECSFVLPEPGHTGFQAFKSRSPGSALKHS